ncbi:hypothetical protein PINS_up012039 [Pythium insidiosum]|nr:hypothetical protein PINS_up012039 [Pythium insidiosum]
MATDPSTPTAYEISAPFGLRHDLHVRYNYAEARFEGVPESFLEYLSAQHVAIAVGSPTSNSRSTSNSNGSPSKQIKPKAKRSRAWSSSKDAGLTKQQITEPLLLNQQFRLHFRHVPRVPLHGYTERIPAVLVMLQHHFLAKQGNRVPYIFRESPNKADRDAAMHEINLGTFNGSLQDVRVLADLIKLWFRELPVPILHEIPCDQMEMLGRLEQSACVAQVEAMLGPLELAIVHWLADLLAVVAESQEENHMGVDQLAIIIAPNLVRIETENPMVAVTVSKASVQVFRAVVRTRFQRRQCGADDELKENIEPPSAVAPE